MDSAVLPKLKTLHGALVDTRPCNTALDTLDALVLRCVVLRQTC